MIIGIEINDCVHCEEALLAWLKARKVEMEKAMQVDVTDRQFEHSIFRIGYIDLRVVKEKK